MVDDAGQTEGLVVTRLSTTPVKGLRLHHPAEIRLEPYGAVGDRQFFLVNEADRISSITHVGALARFRADYEPGCERLRVVGDDGTVCEDTVRLGGAVVADSFDHQVPAHEVLGPWSEMFSAACGRSLRLVRADEPGAGCDVAAATLIGEASIAELGRRSGLGTIDPRRFRMLIQFSSATPHLEDTWNGRIVEVGETLLGVGGPVPRCAATTRHPDRGDRDAPIVRAIRDYRGVAPTAAHDGVPFGVYGDVLRGGRVRVGDRIVLADAA